MTSSDDVQLATDSIGGWAAVLSAIADGSDLPEGHSQAAMQDILAGQASDAQIAAFCVGLRLKGVSVPELVGLTRSMLDVAAPLRLPPEAVDIVGTGGSAHRQRHALNVSTMASLVVAGAGAVVCKHGNRKASSTSGSFDFLEALGVDITISAADLEACVVKVGVGFAFAPTFHPAMRFVGPVRAELGIPTVFNLLGPLAHPGRPRYQLVGTASSELAEKMAHALQKLGTVKAWVVVGHEGYDELTLTGPATVFEVDSTGVQDFVVDAAAAGLEPVASFSELAGGDGAVNAQIFSQILAGEERGPRRDIVTLNAGAALYIAGKTPDLPAGVELANRALDDGSVSAVVAKLRGFGSES